MSTKMTLTDFISGLYPLLPGCRDTKCRPFVCDGFPLDCRIFIVGFNAKSDLGPFRQFWSDDTGFDKPLFNRKYRESGRNPNNRSTNRYWINLISGTVKSCLETNIYSTHSNTADSLPLELRKIAAFDYIFDCLKPQVLFCYNAKTIEKLQKRVGIKIPLVAANGAPRRATMRGHSFYIIGHNHGWLSKAAPYADRLTAVLSDYAGDNRRYS